MKKPRTRATAARPATCASLTLLASALALAAGGVAHAEDKAAEAEATVAVTPAASDIQASAKLRLQWDERGAAHSGPLHAANAVLPGTYTALPDGATAQGELHAQGRQWQWTATVQRHARATPGSAQAWVNEAAVNQDVGNWRFSAGKKIISWDVGYGFRPNDMVQQEERRTLVSSTAEGRAVVAAEHFDADTAWSWVWVNPTHDRDARGAAERALAARVYQRQGALDLYGFARQGAHTGASVGAAVAWVANDATEVHASWRGYTHADVRRSAATTAELDRASSWLPTQTGRGTQALVGFTWTHESQLSVMMEAWWDGTALSGAQWQDWSRRNALLPQLQQRGAPAAAVAGNLAWQGDAFSASSNLHQRNLYARLSWDHEGWQPTLDMLYHPTDRGRLMTAGLLYKGDRYQVQAVLRSSAGPATSVLAQLPTARQANITYTLSF